MSADSVIQSPDESGAPSPKTSGTRRAAGWRKLAVLVGFAAVAVTAYIFFGDALTFESLAQQEAALQEARDNHPVLVYGAAFLIYVAVTGFSIPGAAVLTLIFGWYFGFRRGVLLVSFASTAGATLAFLMSRYVLRGSIQNRFGERLAAFNRALERDGSFYLFTLRLIPAVPFFVINLVMGVTPVRTWTFWWVSQLGMLPGTAVYVYAGSAVPDLETLSESGVGGILSPQIVVAFVLLGLFPLAVKLLMNKIRRPELTVDRAESTE